MKVSPVDLNLLAALDAILTTESVSGAARQVGVTKTAMSHALSRLRAQMGDPILVRAGTDWQLSERATALREQVRELVAAAGVVLEKDERFEPRKSVREFRIHATDHMVSLIAAAIGAALAEEAPYCTLRYMAVQADELTPLRGGQVDVALGAFRELAPELRTRALFRERFACVVRRGHPQIRGQVSMKSFLAMNHVVVAPQGGPGGYVDTLLRDQGITRKLTRFVPYFVVALDLVSRTDCLVTISERLATAYADRFGLQVLKPPVALPPVTVSQVWHPRVDADPAHRWFRRLVARVATEVANP